MKYSALHCRCVHPPAGCVHLLAAPRAVLASGLCSSCSPHKALGEHGLSLGDSHCSRWLCCCCPFYNNFRCFL